MKSFLKQSLLLLTLLVLFQVQASATDLSIQATTIDWSDSRTTGLELWVFSDQPWTDIGGFQHGAGNPKEARSRIFTQRVSGLTNNTSAHRLSLPVFSLTPTLNAIRGNSVRLTFWIMQVIGQNITPINSYPGAEDGFQIPATLTSISACSPATTCATWTDLIVQNSPSPPLPRDRYYTTGDVDRLLLAVSGATSLAQLPFGSANQLHKTNVGGTAIENATLSVGTSGSDFGVAFGAGTVTVNLPNAGASARGAVTTGSQTFAGDKTFTGTTAHNPTGSTLNRALTSTQTASGTTGGANYALNNLTINSDDADAGGFFVAGYSFNHIFGGAAAKGGRSTVNAELGMSAATNPSNNNQNYVAGVFLAYSSVNDNGTNTGAGARGAMFGLNPVAVLLPGATNYLEITGGEVNVAAQTGSSLKLKQGWSISSWPSDAVQGAVLDAMLGLSNQVGAVGWKSGIQFHEENGAFPISTTGTLLKTSNAGAVTVDKGIDISSLTFTTAAFKSPNFTVNGSGWIGAGNTTFDGWVNTLYPIYVARINSIAGQSGSNASLAITQNAYFDGSVWKYIESSATNSGATGYIANGNTHTFRVSNNLSQSAGGTVTWVNALTTDTAGNVTVPQLLKAGSGPTTLTDAAGKILSAALNTVAIANGGTGDTGTAWASYSPTVTTFSGSITTLGTVTGRYKQLGKTVWFQVSVSITTIGTGAGYIKATLPFTAAAFAYTIVGKENAVTGKQLTGQILASGTTLDIRYYDATCPCADGVTLELSGVYEVP